MYNTRMVFVLLLRNNGKVELSLKKKKCLELKIENEKKLSYVYRSLLLVLLR